MSGHFEHFGKYILLEKLATGGMAEVFLARGSGAGGIGKFFAIKRILPQYADSPEFIEMFKDEAKIAINLNHSNIVSIHEFGVEKGQFFLVMDYVEGRNLRQILNKMKKASVQFSIDQIVFVIKEVASGLDHAHRCIDGSTGKPLNITHRDMSPQNVMVSFEGEVKIVDFGIAKAESQIESTRAGTLKGKFGYMSPEQAEGQPVDLRTDIFSLGIVLWELLANDRLFVANNEINTLRKIRDCQIPSLRKINPNIHTELERIVQKALARDRNLRYQTGAALQRDLSRFLNRQYPDFSGQDFSVFVKSVFADEILSLRKRLVEYAKVNLSVSLNVSKAIHANAKQDEDSTSLVETNTNSMMLTESDSQNSSPSVAPQRSDDDSLVTASNPLSSPSVALSNPSLQISSTLTNMLDDSQRTVMDPSTGSKSTSPSVLDDEVLKNAINPNTMENASTRVHNIQPIEIKAGDVLQAPDLNVPTPPEIQIANPRPSSPRPSAPRVQSLARPSASSSGSGSSMRMVSIVVSAVFCLSAYSYLAKYFTGMMTPVLTMTDPYLHFWHSMLGIDLTTGERQTAGTPKAAIPDTSAGTADPFESTGLVVTSNPSGAEIILNEQSTGMVTPSRVEVNGAFTIVIRKKGYAEFTVKDATRDSIGHRLDATLQKLNIAYLDVEIFPPQPANLFINGKQYVLKRTTVREIPVPGGIPIKVRAEAIGSGSFEEQVVNIPTDKRKVIQLNPRKSARQPSSRD